LLGNLYLYRRPTGTLVREAFGIGQNEVCQPLECAIRQVRRAHDISGLECGIRLAPELFHKAEHELRAQFTIRFVGSSVARRKWLTRLRRRVSGWRVLLLPSLVLDQPGGFAIRSTG